MNILRGRRTRWTLWCSVAFVGTLLFCANLPVFAKTAPSEKEVRKLAAKKECYKARSMYENKLRKKMSKAKQAKMDLLLARCFQGYYSFRYGYWYLHYYARHFYQRLIKNKAAPLADQLEAHIAFTRDRLRYVYYHKGNYYARRRKAFRKRLGRLRKLLAKHKVARYNDMYGEVELLELGYLARVRKYQEAHAYTERLNKSKFSARIRGRALLFLTKRVLPKQHRGSLGKVMRVRYLQEILKKFKGKAVVSEAATTLAQLLKGDRARFPKVLALLRRAKKQKARYWSEQASNLLDTMTTPEMVPMFTMQLPPDKPQAIKVHLKRMRKATLRLYKADLLQVFRKERNLFSFDQLKLKKPVLTREVKLAKKIKLHWAKGSHAEVKFKLPALKAGNYVLELQGENRYKRGKRVRMPLFVSHTQVMLKQARDAMLVAVVDGRNSAPLPQSTLYIGVNTKNVKNKKTGQYVSGWHKLMQARTDGSGVFFHRFKGVNYRRPVRLIACQQEACTYVNSNVFYRSYGRRRYRHHRRFYHGYYYYNRLQHKLFWTTDRGAYRPGQKVFFKGIYHRQQRGTWQKSEGRHLRVVVRSSKGKELFRKRFVLGALGTFDGELQLPKEADLGSYTVLIQALYGKKKKWVQHNFTKYFRVEEYRRPKFMVSARLLSGTPVAGDPLKWKISARYTFGGPVKGGKVKWKLHRELDAPQFSFPRPFAWYFKQQSRYSYWRSRRYSRYRHGSDQYYYFYYRYWMNYYKNYMQRYPRNARYYKRSYERYRRLMQRYAGKMKPFAAGEGKLNARGELVVKTPSKGAKKKYYRYILSAEVTDLSRRTIKGKGSTLLGKKGAMVYLRTTKKIVLPGEKVKLLVRVLRPDGVGVAVKGKVYISRTSAKGAAADNAEQTLAAQTDAQGRGIVSFTADYLGHFRLTFAAKLPSGQTVQSDTTLWLGSDKLKNTDYPYPKLEVVADREIYEIGQQATILVNTPKVPKSFLVTVEGESLTWSKVVPAIYRSTVFRMPILASFAPNVWVTVSYLYKGRRYMAQRRIVVPPLDRFLKVKVSSFKKSYKPGEKVEWKVKVTDRKGKPVKSELLLFAYDKSLDLIGKVALPDIRKTFYDRHQRRNVITVAGLDSIRGFRWRLRKRAYSTKKKKKPKLGDARSDDAGPRQAGGKRARRAASPRPVAAAEAKKEVALGKSGKKDANREDGAKALKKARKRQDFRETAVWLARIKTDAEGNAVVSFRWPDSLTSWTVRAVAIGEGVKVAAIEKETRTHKKLMAQIAAPRFFTAGDKAHVAVVVFNRGEAQKVRVTLKATGVKVLASAVQKASLKAGSVRSFVFRVQASDAGPVKLWAEAASTKAADSVERKRTVIPFGLDQHQAVAGSLFKQGKRTLKIALPSRFSKGSGHLELALSSSLTRSVFDSLGYLVKFPYGCVEQTMSRFLPAVLVAKTLAGLDKADPKLAKKLPKVIAKGMQRLVNFQHDDGGWGWWHHDDTNDFMTAYVIFGLSTAKSAGTKIPAGVIERGAKYLVGRMKELRKKPALHAYALYALSLANKLPKAEVDHSLAKLKKLNAYGLALLSLAYSSKGDAATAKHVLKALHARLTPDRGGEEAYFPGRGTLRGWAEDGIEATAVALRAFVAAKAYKKDWPRLARWLLRNRKGRRWRSTRDTAQAILALARFARGVGEGRGKRAVEIWIDGKQALSRTLLPNDPNGSGARLVLDDARLHKGVKAIEIRLSSAGPVYYAMRLRYRTEEDRIKAGGSGVLTVSRVYYQVRKKGLKESFRRIRWGQAVKSGSEIEVRLQIKAKHRLKYLLFSDRKPAGLEPKEIKSGRPTTPWLSHQEFRDTQVAFFAGAIEKNKTYTVKYRMMAERPGHYRTLPTVGSPMYSPSVSGHSASFLFSIKP